MNTFKDFFKKHLALNLLLVIIPTFLQILLPFLYPTEAIQKWTLIVPYFVTSPIAIIANLSIILLFNIIISSKQQDRIIMCYIAISIIIGGFIFFNILHFIASFMDIDWFIRLQDQISISSELFILWIFTGIISTISIVIACIFFIRTHLQLHKQNKQQKTDTTTA